MPAQPFPTTPPLANQSAALPQLPDGAIIRLGTSRFNQGAQINACTFSPDGKFLVTGGSDATVRVWSVSSGQERRSWRMNSNYNNITAIQYSPDGKMIAVCGGEGLIRVWDAEGVNELFVRTPPRQYDPSWFCWVAKSKQLAIASQNGSVCILEIPSGREIRKWPSGVSNPRMLACSPNGKQLIVASYNSQMKSYDLAAAKEGVVFENPVPGPNGFRPNYGVAYTPDGKFLIGTSPDRTICLWNAETGKIARRVETSQTYIYALAVSPNGRFLAANSNDGRVRLFGLASGAELREFPVARYGAANLMAYSPDGRYLATVSGQSVRIWDVAAGTELHGDAGHRAPVLAGAFLSEGRVVTAGQDQTIRCWDVKSGKEVDRLDQQPIYAAHLVPDSAGRSVLLASNNQFVLKWTPGKSSDIERLPFSVQGSVIALAADGKAAVVQMNQNLIAYSLPDGKQLRQILPPENSYPQAVCVSSGSRYLAFVDNNQNGVVHIWDLIAGHQKRTIAGDRTMQLYAERMIFSPDGRLLVSVAGHRPVLVWEVFTGLVRLVIPQSQVAGQSAAAFSPDGRVLAVGSGAGEVRLIDMRSGATAGPFIGHRGHTTCLAFSQDGKQLISTNTDTTAIVWDVAKLLAKLPERAKASEATPRQLDAWWMGLASGDGAAASEAIWSLSDRPRETLDLFREKLKPVVGPDAATVTKWVGDLDAPKFQVREKSYRNLAGMGESARDQLQEGLKKATSAEARFRITRLLGVINSQVAPAKLQPLRALEVLEKIGGSEAKQQLEALAKQSTDEEIRREIDRVLQRWR